MKVRLEREISQCRIDISTNTLNIDQLKKLFPEIVSEGKIDFKTLQKVLGEEIEDEEEFDDEIFYGDDEEEDSGDEKEVPGAYNPAQYANLNVSSEVKELFEYITRYKP